jgi:hypothetical protein
VFGIIALCFLTAAFVVSITMLRPHDDNTALIATVAGLNSTVVLGLLAATVQQVHLAVNSRLTQLLELTAKSSRAEGKLEG